MSAVAHANPNALTDSYALICLRSSVWAPEFMPSHTSPPANPNILPEQRQAVNTEELSGSMSWRRDLGDVPGTWIEDGVR